jgi:coenzyme F420-reducing hydrogenase alpha subunit
LISLNNNHINSSGGVMMDNKNETQEKVTRAAKSIKDGADAMFDSVENAIEKTESAAMNAVDKTTDAINRAVDREE